MEENTGYVPGVCNINRKEIAYRRKVGYVGLSAFVVLLVVLLFLPISSLFRILLFLPALLGASGFLQARHKFCVGYGAAGKQNAEDGSAIAKNITDQSALAKDKIKTRQINLQSLAVAAIVTIVCMILPHL